MIEVKMRRAGAKETPLGSGSLSKWNIQHQSLAELRTQRRQFAPSMSSTPPGPEGYLPLLIEHIRDRRLRAALLSNQAMLGAT